MQECKMYYLPFSKSDENTNKKNVRKLQKTLLTGSGFNGNTPMFFSNSYSDSGHKNGAN